MSYYDEREWRRVYNTPDGVAVCDSPAWLLNGCPKCGCTTWIVTDDYYAYCESCDKGYSTSWPFTHRLTSLLDKHGTHCPFCRGFGGPCEHCSGQVTQPPQAWREAYKTAYDWCRAMHAGLALMDRGELRAFRRIPLHIRQKAARSLVARETQRFTWIAGSWRAKHDPNWLPF